MMTLEQAIAAAGMTPPQSIVPGRWVRFPGVGKSRSNRAGWCRMISPTLAIFGDWSSDLRVTWRHGSHRDDEESARRLAEARRHERAYALEQRQRQAGAAAQADRLLREATVAKHPYLERKGFADYFGLVQDGDLLIPMRDLTAYERVLGVQRIAGNGEKRFLPGSRTRGAIHRLGVEPAQAARLWLCEGYATGLSIEAALKRLIGPHAVVVCFSAHNLEVVAEYCPTAIVCADNDESGTGEQAAKRTGHRWTMPPEVGTDFNDMHLRHGLGAVTAQLRESALQTIQGKP